MARSKKFKAITNPKDLKAGNFYIRAVVNYRGDFWIEIFKVVQAPFFKIEPHMGGNWKFTLHGGYSKDVHRKKYIDERFFSDYCGRVSTKGFYDKNEELVSVKMRSTALLPFSNKAEEFLKVNSGDVFEFLQAINPDLNITAELVKKLKDEWVFNKY
jgi:hypothetical protein